MPPKSTNLLYLDSLWSSKILIFVVAFWCTQFSSAQPSNDDFSNPINVTSLINSCSTDGQFNTLNATPDLNAGACWADGPHANVWFSFVATATGTIQINLDRGNIPGSMKGDMRFSYMTLWEADGVTELACATHVDVSDDISLLRSGLTSGNTYYVSVDRRNPTPSGAETFTLCLSDQPTNDYLEGATNIDSFMNVCSADAVFTTLGATADQNAASCWPNVYGPGPHRNVWFEVTAPATGTIEVRLDTGGVKGTLQTSMLALWDSSGTEISCNSYRLGSDYDDVSLLARGLSAGSSYYISVDNIYIHAPDTFTLCLNDQPTNDYFEGAADVTYLINGCSIDAEFTTLGATFDRTPGSCWPGIGSDPAKVDHNKWFRFLASASGNIEVNIDIGGSKGTLRYPYMALWESDGTTELACATHVGPNDDISMQAYGLIPGNAYYISVDNLYETTTETFTLCLNELAGPASDTDTDGDGVGNTVDLDDDNDGILDIDEGCGKTTLIESTIGYGNAVISTTYVVHNANLVYTVIGPTNASIEGYDAGLNGAAIRMEANPGTIAFGNINSSYEFPIRSLDFKLTDFDSNEIVTVSVYDENGSLYNLSTGSYVIVGSDISQNGNIFSAAGTDLLDGNDPASDGAGSLQFFFPEQVSRVDISYRMNGSTPDPSIIFTEPTYCSSINSDFVGDIPDYFDLDSDDDGIPDNVEAQTTIGYIPPNADTPAMYITNNGVNSAYLGGLTPVDTDGDGEPDFIDMNSDNEGPADFAESGLTFNNIDSDLNGLDDNMDVPPGAYSNPQGMVGNPLAGPVILPDGDSDATSGGDVDFRDNDGTASDDADNDGVADSFDLDDDNDGIKDDLECGNSINSIGNGGAYASRIHWLEFTGPDFVDNTLDPGDSRTFTNSGGDVLTVEVFLAANPAQINNPQVVTAPFYQNGYVMNSNAAIFGNVGNASYTFRFSAVNSSGTSIPANILATDAELTNNTPTETLTFTTNGSPWTILEDLISTAPAYSISNLNTTAVTLRGTDVSPISTPLLVSNGTTQLTLTHDAPSGSSSFVIGWLTTSSPCADTDNDGVENSLDLDSDNDGIFDVVEAGHGVSHLGGQLTGPFGTDGISNSVQASGRENSGNVNYGVRESSDDSDTIYNFLDLDSDGDGIPDNVEAQTTQGYSVPNADAPATYLTNNGLNSAYPNGINPINTDSDILPDYLDINSDDEGTGDSAEAGISLSGSDSDGDGLDDTTDATADYSDVGGTIDDPLSGPIVFSDSDSDVNSGGDVDYRDGANNSVDSDTDGTPDVTDLDDDNDGILDIIECGDPPRYGNQSFELGVNPAIALSAFGPAPNAYLFNEGDIPNWETTASDNRIEIWESGHLGIPSYAGSYHAELNAEEISALFQEYTSTPGEFTSVTFAHRGRNGVDVMEVFQGPPGGPYTSLGQFSTGQNWQVYSTWFIVPAGQTTSQIRFEAISSSNGSNLQGNLLDDIYIYEGCSDADNDGIYNGLDLDSDNDGIYDVIEAGHAHGQTNGRLNGASGTNGIPDIVETTPDSGMINYTPAESTDDADANRDYVDLDSDGDGIPDNVEAQTTQGYTAPNPDDATAYLTNNGVNTAYLGGLVPTNTDSTDNPDYLDLNSDNEGANDITEAAITLSGNDVDFDGLDDAADADTASFADPGGFIDNPISGAVLLPDTDSDATTTGDVDFRDTTDDTIDNDGDGVSDIDDLDDDNDGILDTVEGCEDTDVSGTIGIGNNVSDTTYPIIGTDLIYTLNNPDNAQIIGYDAGLNGFGIRIGGVAGNTGSLTSEYSTPISFAFFKLTDFDNNTRCTVEVYDENNVLYDLSVEGVAARGSIITQTGNYFEAAAIDSNGDDPADDVLGSILFYFERPVSRIVLNFEFPSDSSTRFIQPTFCIQDSDGDGISDHKDLDADNDGIPDNIEAQTTTGYIAPNADDAATYATNNGVNSAYLGGLTPTNTDTADNPDYLDLDSDNEGDNDTVEASITLSGNDVDTDGLDDATDADTSGYADPGGTIDNPLIAPIILPDVDSDAASGGDVDFRDALDNRPDNDNDGLVDVLDFDDDNDGILDTDEGCGNLIINGSFEQDDFTDGGVYANAGANGAYIGADLNTDQVSAWTYTQNMDGWVEGGTWAPAYHGVQYMDIVGAATRSGGIMNELSQVINTVPGNSYRLSFYWGEDWGHNSGDTVDLQIDVIDDTSTTIFNDNQTAIAQGDIGGTRGPNNWFYYENTFIATTTQTTVRFTSNAPGPSLNSGANIDFVSVTIASPSSCRDTDNDGIIDAMDLDSDNDGIFDAVEAGHGQSHTNGVVDGTTGADGIPDTAQNNADGETVNYSLAESADDADTIPNFLDLDADGDGIPDTVEAQTTLGYVAPNGSVDANGIDTAYITGLNPTNTDGTDNPDYLDVDSDNEGGNDTIEAAITLSGNDIDTDGLDDVTDADTSGYADPSGTIDNPLTAPVILPDVDADASTGGDVDFRDAIDDSTVPDEDGDGIPNSEEDDNDDGDDDPTTDPTDTDGDGVPNYLDLDADNDGIYDAIEVGHGAPHTNGIVDGPRGTDGIPDAVQDPGQEDSGVVNYIVAESGDDTDTIPDFLDLDSDGDGIPDNIEAQTTLGYSVSNPDDAATYLANNGVNSAYLGGLTPVNSDVDAIPDYLDLNSDQNGLDDAGESGLVLTGMDGDNDGLDDAVDATADYTVPGGTINDPIAGALQLPDFDGDAALAGGDVDFRDPIDHVTDTDLDGIVDFEDLDDDNDGILDVIECGNPPTYSNQSFEEGIVPANADFVSPATPPYYLFNETVLPAWETTAPDGRIEIWESGHNGVASHSGNYHAEINANFDAALFQSYNSAPGEFTSVTFAHRGRAGIDVIEIFQGPPGGPYLSMGQFATDQEWAVYKTWFIVPPGQTTSEIRFEAISTATGDRRVGNLLDSIYIYEGCSETDGDGVEDGIDLDSDNDGIYDAVEAGHGAPHTNGRVDGTEGTDGIPDILQTPGMENGGAVTHTELDSDADGINDHLELDSDDDGCNDVNEAGYTDDDANGLLGEAPETVDANGLVTSGTDGYTVPQDLDTNGVFEYREAGSTAVITDQPLPLSVCEGAVAEFSTITTNADVFQWQFFDGTDWVDLTDTGIYSGTDTDTLTLTATLVENGSRYRLLASNLTYNCEDISDEIELLVEASPSLTIDDASVTEGGDMIVPITLSGPACLGQDITLTFSFTDGTADGTDYTNTPIQLTIPAGQTTVELILPTSDDTIDEPDEDFMIAVASIDVGALSDSSDTATGTIIDDDVAIDLDTDDDGMLDSFEDLNADGDNDPATDPTNSDNDAYPDYLDIDSDDDGIPDNVEAQTTSGYISPSLIDANDNGVDDAYETGTVVGLIPVNTDGTDLPDFLDADSDNDNVPDNIEGHDYNHDGIADFVIIGSDKDFDGLDDSYEGIEQIDIDVNDEIDDPVNDLPNTDADAESDYRDLDDDGDGIPTIDEDTNGDMDYINDDWDNDGIPDYLDPDPQVEVEDVEIFNVGTPNGDNVHDFLIITGLETRPENTLRIYNRWGILVYTTESYNTSSNVFDGTSQARATVGQSDRLPVGTYFYLFDYVELNGETINLSGHLYLN